MLDSDEQQREIKTFPIWQAHGYFVQLIDGLEYLHSKFIIHNDIKPGNLLITVEHQLKITDFGTAEQLDMFSTDDTITRSQGTPAFQCPEIANGEDTYNGFSIDIWSCGVTLYNLVTGRLPFEADNIYLLFQTIGKGVYTIPDDIESHLASFIHGLLHINKNLRLTLEQIKQHEWFRRRPPRTFEFLPFPPSALNQMLDSDEQQREIKTFPIWQAHGYFVQLIDGLEYLHSKFIIHNDIKPGNLLITVEHQLKITDFGTAEQLDMFSTDDTITRSQGTPAFQCPEIANGEDTYNGFSIDIWSCGVTLYNLVTGRLPFEADNIYLLFQTIGKGVYTIPDDIESHLASFIHGLLHINKNLRLTLEQIKQHEWFRRRPPRTFEFLPFPPSALNRFQTFTMHDYLTELHRSTVLSEEENHNDNHQEEQQQQIKIPIDSNSFFHSPYDNQHVESQQKQQQQQQQHQQEHNGRSRLNCSCSRTLSGENIYPTKTRNRHQPRICVLS
ncbi:unnamed protein product [Adineta steineri]|uniref:non-specific serine/threonine protein kinase n=1 Tax=Adineta steineri TaxID=433720 RepID=A0A814ELJ1_9BILA|nr:unnamed protein product [Adineta steineri]